MLEMKLVDSTMEFSSSKPFINKRLGGTLSNRFQNPKQTGSEVEAELFGLRANLCLLRSNVLIQKFDCV